MTDFFISYNRADKAWAEWIASTLENADYSVVIQAWDFRPGSNFVIDMQNAIVECEKTIAVLSPSYLKSDFTAPEWAAIFAQDPKSLEKKLIPVRVKECQPEGLLRSIVYVDLVGKEREEAQKLLLDALKKRIKENKTYPFPGVKKLSQNLQNLLEILEPIDLSIITEAYRMALPEGRLPDDELTKKALIRRLDEMPEKEQELRPLLRFVRILSLFATLDSDQEKALQNWLQKQGLSPEAFTSVTNETNTEQSEYLLMIEVKSRVLNNPEHGYQISASLVIDPDPSEQGQDNLISHHFDARTIKPKSGRDIEVELESFLTEFLRICGGKEHKISFKKLTIQLLLPKTLQCLPIEHWLMPGGKHCCGQRCKVVIVRSSERYSLEYEYALGDWEENWQQLLKSPNKTCGDSIPLVNKETIQNNALEIFGYRFVEHPQPEIQQQYWEQILDQGLPIAYWLRRRGMTPEEVKEKAEELSKTELENCAVVKLKQKLSEKRQQHIPNPTPSTDKEDKCALTVEEKFHNRLKQSPFALLWDNPFRPFPSINYES